VSNKELLELINSLSNEPIDTIESVDSISKEDSIIVIGTGKVKRLEFTLTTSGDFSYKYLGVKLKKFA
jgi:hypothetical protein